jgi:hypothetical protein
MTVKIRIKSCKIGRRQSAIDKGGVVPVHFFTEHDAIKVYCVGSGDIAPLIFTSALPLGKEPLVPIG